MPSRHSYSRADRAGRACAAVLLTIGGVTGLAYALLGARGWAPGVASALMGMALLALAWGGARGAYDRRLGFELSERALSILRPDGTDSIPRENVRVVRHARSGWNGHAALIASGSRRPVRIYYSLTEAGDLIQILARWAGENDRSPQARSTTWRFSWSRVIAWALIWILPFVLLAIPPWRQGAIGAVVFLAAIAIPGAAIWFAVTALGARAVTLEDRALWVATGIGRTRTIPLGEITGLRIRFLTRSRSSPVLWIESQQRHPISLPAMVVDPLELLARLVRLEPAVRELVDSGHSRAREA